MITPQRRIWIVQPHAYTDPHYVEVLVLGEPDDIAAMVATVAHALSLARGLRSMQPLVMGTQQIGYAARRGNNAVYDNPIAEVHRELQQHVPVGVLGWDVDEDHVMGGTW